MAQSSALQNHNKVCVVRSMWLRAVPREGASTLNQPPRDRGTPYAPVSNESAGHAKASRRDSPQRAAEGENKEKVIAPQKEEKQSERCPRLDRRRHPERAAHHRNGVVELVGSRQPQRPAAEALSANALMYFGHQGPR